MSLHEDREIEPAHPPGPLEARFEGWIRVFLSDPMLKPLYAVLLGHAVAFLVPVIVLAMRDRNLAALAAMTLLLVGSGIRLHADWQRYRRPGPIGGTLLTMWVLAVAAAGAAAHYGFC